MPGRRCSRVSVCDACVAAPPVPLASRSPSPPRCLEEAILNFAGTTLVISHDRWFLDRVATHILAFEGDSKVGVWS